MDEALRVLDRRAEILAQNFVVTGTRGDARARGITLSAAGDHEAAIAHCERALELLTESVHDPTDGGWDRLRLGEVLLAAGRPADAVPHLERAVELMDQHWTNFLDRHRARFLLARAIWESGGDRERALALARTALAAYREIGNDPVHRRQLEKWLRSVGDD